MQLPFEQHSETLRGLLYKQEIQLPDGKDSVKETVRLTEVHTFTGDITDEEAATILVNQTLKEDKTGPEDKHVRYVFKSYEELQALEKAGKVLKNTLIFSRP